MCLVIMANTTTDSHGLTIDDERAHCARIAAKHGTEINGRRLTIGRLYYKATGRKWGWGERWEKDLEPKMLDHGSKFVPVEFYAA